MLLMQQLTLSLTLKAWGKLNFALRFVRYSGPAALGRRPAVVTPLFCARLVAPNYGYSGDVVCRGNVGAYTRITTPEL
jgi:hypothetical protein